MLNKAVLMGRLTSDPELRHTQNNTPVTSFTLAVNRSFTKQGSEPTADFIDIVAWSSTAEFVSKYFRKGLLVAVAGRIQTRTYEKDGQKRKAFEIVAEEVHFAESKKDSPAHGDPAASDTARPAATGNDFNDITGDDDELPF